MVTGRVRARVRDLYVSDPRVRAVVKVRVRVRTRVRVQSTDGISKCVNRSLPP